MTSADQRLGEVFTLAHTFARGDGDVGDQGVEFVGGVLVLVTLPGQPDAYPVRHVPAGRHGGQVSRAHNSALTCQRARTRPLATATEAGLYEPVRHENMVRTISALR